MQRNSTANNLWGISFHDTGLFNTEAFQMKTIQRSASNVAAITLLFGLMGCTVIGAGIGAVAGSGSAVGVVGGAVIGGVIGHAISH